MKTTFVGVVDPPRVLRDGDIVDGEMFVLQAVSYGRVLFTSVTALLCVGHGVTVRNCIFRLP